MVGVSTEGLRVDVDRPSARPRATTRRVSKYQATRAIRDRAVLVLHDDGFTVEEIALALGFERIAVSNRLEPMLELRRQLRDGDG